MTSRGLAVTFALALCAVTRSALAQEPPKPRTSSLSWIRLDGAESCIATQPLATAVEQRLGRTVFVSASAADVSVEGHIQPARPRGWHAVFSVRDASGKLLGTRKLDSQEAACEALNEPLAFVVAVLIDPDAANRSTPPPTPAEPAPVPPTTERVIVVEREAPAPPPPPEPWRFQADAFGAFGVGMLPGLGTGVSLGALLEPPHFWGIRLSGTYWLDASADAANGATVTFSLAYGALMLCPLRYAAGRVGVHACAGGQVGSARTRGVGFDVQRTDEATVVNAAAGGRIAIDIVKPLEAVAMVTMAVPIVRDSLSYTRADGTTFEVFRPAVIGGVGEIGVGVHFP